MVKKIYFLQVESRREYFSKALPYTVNSFRKNIAIHYVKLVGMKIVGVFICFNLQPVALYSMKSGNTLTTIINVLLCP